MRKRFEREHRTRYRLQEKDYLTVEAVFKARYLTTGQVLKLLYRPTLSGWCKRRLRLLFDLGYLRKRDTHINEPDVYYLGLKGRHYIAQLPENPYTLKELGKIAGVSGGGEIPFLFMNHDLTLSNLYVNARLECESLGLQIEWRNSIMLEMMKLGFQPDAFLKVYNGKKLAALIEFTAVVPTDGELRKKIEAYEEYLESGACEEDFGVENVGVMWVTTSRAKLERIRKAVIQSQYRDWFLLGLIDDMKRFVTEPVWVWGETGERVPFFR